MKARDRVRVMRLPERLPAADGDDLNTRRIFELCLGREFPIVSVLNGLIELEVGEVVFACTRSGSSRTA